MSFPPNLGITSSFIIDSSSSLLFQEFPTLLPQLERIRSPFSRTKMNGYSRINKANTTRSKSVDFADLSFPHHMPKSTPSFCSMHNTIPENMQEDGMGEVFGVILSRKCAISTAPSDQVVVDEATQESLPFQTAVKKTLSIKRSTSVSEGYSRIHHQSDLTAEDDDDQYGAQCNSQKRNVKKKGKFFKACKRLFGL